MKTQHVEIRMMKITPKIASEWLADRWGEQRAVRQAHVVRLANDMTSGRFKISPDAILRVNGKLANGQHRLEAVVRSGKAQWFLVMESTDEQLYKALDSGLRRTVADALGSVPYATHIPAMARWVIAYQTKNVQRACRRPSHAAAGNGPFPTQCEMIDYCQSNIERLSDAATFVTALYEQTHLLSRSIAGALYLLGKMHNKGKEVEQFLRAVYVEGGANVAGDFRNKLIAAKGKRSKTPAGYTFVLTLKAFIAFCAKKRPATLRWSPDDGMPTL